MMKKTDLYSAAAAYVLWGLFPAFFKLLKDVPAVQIVGHRIFWSFLFLLTLILIGRELPGLRASLTPRLVLIYLGSGVLLSCNWLIYVWAVNSGFVVEGSLGYFINPLVNVLLGTIFLGERLRPTQWIPIGLATIGVLYLTISYGSLPWIALALALTFGFYGLIKKLAPLSSLKGLTLETGMVFLPALVYLIVIETQGTGAFGHISVLNSVLLALTGVVTAVPLILFANGARTVPLSTMGLLQYCTPTLQFLLGVFIYSEAFTHERMIGFSIIWVGLIIFSVESFYHRRRLSMVKAGD